MRNLSHISIILFLSFLGLLLVHSVVAEDLILPNGSYVIVSTPAQDSPFSTDMYGDPLKTYRITQGQRVYVNDTIDIAGMGHGQLRIAWYGTYSEHDDPLYIYEFSLFRRDLLNFWLNPEIFGNRTGMWYQYYGNQTERNGNLAAFYVIGGYRNMTMTYPNGTVVNLSYAVRGNGTPMVIPVPSILPEIHDADYLLAIGDPLIMKVDGKANVWVFGQKDMAYRETEYENMTFPASDFEAFIPDHYRILVQYPGKNTEFDIRYRNGTLQYRDGWNGVKNVSVSAGSPQTVLAELRKASQNTDDVFLEYSLEIQQPYVTITSMDEVWLKSKMLDYHIDNTADVTFKDVRGYTNFRNQTNISVMLDNTYVGNKGIGRFSTYAQTWQSVPGNRTAFQAYVPVVWDTIPLGIHTITAMGPRGAYSNADFAVELMPADSYRPNVSLKYTGDSNPWKPNLTVLPPVIIEKPVPGPVVTVIVTPSNEQVKAAQEAIVAEREAYWITTGAVVLAVLLALGYLYWVVRRWRKP